MAIQIGQRLGSYEITALLGKGGMGEVYRARDSKLKRDVAIKILPDEFSRDAVRASRFQREAEVLAALNHPNIASIYDVQESDAAQFLVLELVEGDTLADILGRRGALPVDEALQIAKQICEGLEAAHEKGVVHRDLKPANVKITPDGKVKVLDFGLAKARENAAANASMSNSPTLSLAGTVPGVILGTAGYMSPEQAKGFDANPQSDIFSFGCLLYEMLTGRHAFDGDTISEILASVLKSEVDLSVLPAKLNPRIHELLRRCLEKNPKRRWHAAADVRVEIEGLIGSGMLVEEPHVTVNRPLWKRAIVASAWLLTGAAIAGVGVWTLKPSPVLPITRFPILLGEGQQFIAVANQMVTISPDGTAMVYLANRQLYLRSMSELEARPVPGTGGSFWL
jgi:serine/threonine protein kinase